MIFSPDSVRPTAFAPHKYRNALLDTLFYDVGALTVEERSALSPWIDREGSVLVVSPSGSGREIRHYKSALRFFTNDGDQVAAIAVAGVGSSALGTAALARNVADALDCDVAGLVTGYGTADVLSEAMGGWFYFGALDATRLEFKRFWESMRDSLPESKAVHRRHAPGPKPPVALPGNQDTGTLLDILIAQPPNLRMIVGHSKGALLIDYVLDRFVSELNTDAHPFFDDLLIVTIGTVVGLSDKFKRVRQYLGEYDWFGRMNSRQGLAYHSVPNAWHHLNTNLPNHVSVESILAGLPLDA